MNNSNLARSAMFDIINSGAPIDEFLSSISADRQTLCDATGALVDAYLALRRENRLKVRPIDPRMQSFLQGSKAIMLTQVQAALNSRDATQAGLIISTLMTSVSASRSGLTFSEATPDAPALKMQIVAMPARETVTSVKYTSNGNIQSSSQIQSDI